MNKNRKLTTKPVKMIGRFAAAVLSMSLLLQNYATADGILTDITE